MTEDPGPVAQIGGIGRCYRSGLLPWYCGQLGNVSWYSCPTWRNLVALVQLPKLDIGCPGTVARSGRCCPGTVAHRAGTVAPPLQLRQCIEATHWSELCAPWWYQPFHYFTNLFHYFQTISLFHQSVSLSSNHFIISPICFTIFQTISPICFIVLPTISLFH